MKVAQAAAQIGDNEFAMAIANAGRKAQSEMALTTQRTAEKMTNEQRNALAYASQFGTPDSQAFKDAYKERFDQLTLKAGQANKPFEFEAKEARLQELKSSLRVLENQPVQNKEAIQRLKDSIQAIEGSEKQDIPKIGVSEATGEAVFYDRNQDLQFVKRKDPKDPTKQIRVPFEGRIDQTTSKVSASASSQQESEFSKDLGKADADRVKNAMATRENAIGTLTSLNRLNELNQQDLISGTFASGRVGATNLISTLGLASGKDIDRLSASENYQKTAGDVILATLGGKLGAGFSNEDRKFIQSLVPQLENSPQARKQLVEFMVKKNNSIVEETTRLENYARDNKSLKGYVPKIPVINLGGGVNKPVSQMTRQELLDEEARLLGNKKP
jgi:DNA-directed RNA polymerase subunit F